MNKNKQICLVSCSVLEPELNYLIKTGKLDVDLVFINKNFHVDYSLIEQNIRKTLKSTLKRYPGKVVLVYGDLCLGPDNEMNQLAKEYGVVKIEALNCIDCQLGGKGKFETADPEHKLMFMSVGMIDFFKDIKTQLAMQGVFDEVVFQKMFSNIEGFIILDTVNNSEECLCELEKLNIGVKVIEIRKIGVENVCSIVLEAMENLKNHDDIVKK
ncbi:MAG: DUF1638 domain-containing protein [Candidatus Bathyarchaeota archaeon]|nr:DUF1638 domain-containing protein [Candidatus Termiticorpusculum sp.]